MSTRYAVLGSPIAHSLSPVLHRAAFAASGRAATYDAIDVGEGALHEVLPRLAREGYAGLNLTAPLKRAGLFLAAEATPRAGRAGAANTLRRDGDRWIADNTDGAGFVNFLARAAVAAAGARVTVLGGGGATAGLVPALLDAGAGTIAIVTRQVGHDGAGDPRVEVLAASAEVASPAAQALRTSTLVIQATPLGLAAGDPLPCPPDWVGPRAVAIDLLYHPPVTPWLAALRARGVKAANGLGLLVEQALLAQEFWFGQAPPRHALEEAVAWGDPFSPPGGLPAG
ncbi:MAG: shikimate dehydrogenase [Candidatus Eisenbacteria bacterium]